MAYILQPCGQGTLVVGREEYLTLDDRWPDHWPTFDAFCAATCYDPMAKDGGPTYQKVKQWCLTSRRRPSVNLKKPQPGSFLKVSRPPNESEPEEGQEMADKDRKYAPKDVKYFKNPEFEYYGGTFSMNNTTSDSPKSAAGIQREFKGAWDEGSGVFKQSFLDLQAGSGCPAAGNVMSWYESAGLDRNFKGGTDLSLRCDAAGNPMSTFLSGIGKAETLENGCPTLGLALAAYFGMYDYPDPEGTVQCATTKIWMRVPNPRYGYDGYYLFAKEPLLPIPGHPQFTQVGGEYGIRVPVLRLGRLTMWHQIAFTGKDSSKTGRAKKNVEQGKSKKGHITCVIGGWAGRAMWREDRYDDRPVHKDEVLFASAPPAQGEPGHSAEFAFKATNAVEMDLWYQLLRSTPWNGRMFKRDDFDPNNLGAQKGGRAFGWHFPMTLLQKLPPGPRYEELTPKNHMYQRAPEWRRDRSQWIRAVGDKKFDSWSKPLCAVFKIPQDFERYARDSDYSRFHEDDRVLGDRPERIVSLLEMLEVANQGHSSDAGPSGAGPANAELEEEPDWVQAIQDKFDDYLDEQARQANAELADEGGEIAIDEGERAPKDIEGDGLEVTAVGNETSPEEITDTVVADYAQEEDAKNKVERTYTASGSKRRAGQDFRGHNEHFTHNEMVPFSHAELYYPNEHSYTFKPVDSIDRIKAYEAKYGSATNMLLGGVEYREITGVEAIFGNPIKLMKDGKPLSIFEARILDVLEGGYTYADYKGQPWKSADYLYDMFLKSFYRMLNIYFADETTFGFLKNESRIGDKRKMMLGGVWQSKSNPKAFFNGPGKGSANKPVFPKVFQRGPHNSHKRFSDMSKVPDLEPESIANLIQVLNPNYTVKDWIMSPWHLESLPLREKSSHFVDAETFSCGCTRCARPFYEYKEKYMALPFPPHRDVAHWVHAFWEPSEGETPLPFHHGDFWKQRQAVGMAVPEEEVMEALTEDSDLIPNRGYHNWETYLFAMPQPEKDSRAARIYGGKDAPKSTLAQNLKRCVFKKYLNPNYAEEGGKPDKDRQHEVTQGFLRWGKMRFGMQGYRLQRSLKYGNVCVDCAAVLDLCGLYKRSGIRKDGQKDVRGPKTRADSWYDQFDILEGEDIGTDEDGNTITFDLDVLHSFRTPKVLDEKKRQVDSSALSTVKEKYGEQWEVVYDLHLEAMSEVKKDKTCEMIRDPQTNKIVTKMLRPPSVFPQMNYSTDDSLRIQGKSHEKKWRALDEASMDDTMSTLNALIKTLDSNWKDSTEGREGRAIHESVEIKASVNKGNRALRDALSSAVYDLGFRDSRKQSEGRSTKFDPMQMRKEERAHKHSNKWNACLKIKQVRVPGRKGVDAVYDEYHKEKVWKAGIDADGNKVADGNWQPDMFVQAAIRKAERRATEENVRFAELVTTQYRRLQQSRFFITYALHRRLYDEIEARHVMERMANAIRHLFSNDVHLCKMIVFGQTLIESQGDTMGKLSWTNIKGHRKKEDRILGEREFYGNEASNSYMYDTYETHVDTVEVDAGVEIGPTNHHPHFHLLLTINHYSMLQIDVHTMRALFEALFKGRADWLSAEEREDYVLRANDGNYFYTDAETPYMKVKLYPTDDWAEVISAYVRKGVGTGMFSSLKLRTGV